MPGKKGKRGARKSQSGEQVCGTCSRDPGDNPIGCDECEVWVHSTEMCSGLPEDLIHAILNYGGEGIRFICMTCRLKPSPPAQAEGSASTAGTGQDQVHLIGTIQQLFQQFRGMCSMIADLSDQFKHLTEAMKSPPVQSADQASMPGPAPGPQPPISNPPEQPALRDVIAEEVREMREREKRKQSIIIKSQSTKSTAEVVNMFKELSSSKFGCEITLTEVSPIKDHTGMFRAKITSDEQRKRALDGARTLKGTRYDTVYISRDLTWAQRKANFEKRQAKRVQIPATSDAAPSSSPARPTPPAPAPAPAPASALASAPARPTESSAGVIPRSVTATFQGAEATGATASGGTQGN